MVGSRVSNLALLADEAGLENKLAVGEGSLGYKQEQVGEH